jgi:hypothetical protein
MVCVRARVRACSHACGGDRWRVADQTGTAGLNTHGWADGTTALLGYGDGSLRLFDVRQPGPGRCVVAFRDPHVDCVGDVVFDPQRKIVAVFGAPRFSVWRYQSSGIT